MNCKLQSICDDQELLQCFNNSLKYDMNACAWVNLKYFEFKNKKVRYILINFLTNFFFSHFLFSIFLPHAAECLLNIHLFSALSTHSML